MNNKTILIALLLVAHGFHVEDETQELYHLPENPQDHGPTHRNSLTARVMSTSTAAVIPPRI